MRVLCTMPSPSLTFFVKATRYTLFFISPPKAIIMKSYSIA